MQAVKEEVLSARAQLHRAAQFAGGGRVSCRSRRRRFFLQKTTAASTTSWRTSGWLRAMRRAWTPNDTVRRRTTRLRMGTASCYHSRGRMRRRKWICGTHRRRSEGGEERPARFLQARRRGARSAFAGTARYWGVSSCGKGGREGSRNIRD